MSCGISGHALPCSSASRHIEAMMRSSMPPVWHHTQGRPDMHAMGGVQHPGFDFSGAEFNGAAPDARSFMGGMPSGI